MNWLLFYLLLALHPIAYFVIVRMDASWAKRALLLIATFAPATVYCWNYFAIQHVHKKLCTDEGGLSVLIQPEKVDRVRIVGRNTGASPRGMLQSWYPKVRLVQALTEKRDPKTGYLLDYYEAYTASPNPSTNHTIPGAIGGGDLLIASTRLEEQEMGIFELSLVVTGVPHGRKTETILSKDGKIYAKHTAFVHWWDGVQYPDGGNTWRCPDMDTKIPPKDEPAPPYERWVPAPLAAYALSALIFK